MIFIGIVGVFQMAGGILLLMFAPYQILGAALFVLGVISFAIVALIR